MPGTVLRRGYLQKQILLDPLEMHEMIFPIALRKYLRKATSEGFSWDHGLRETIVTVRKVRRQHPRVAGHITPTGSRQA